MVSDQLLKQWIVANYEPNRIYPVVGDWLRIDLIHNAGGLFGFFQGTAAGLRRRDGRGRLPDLAGCSSGGVGGAG